ncbi:MAG: hypothetical protein SFX73_21155 [Kofleriaceae bacterium]|nr:hypothetical protein [Kofleriaceae bacterium]
MRRFLVLALGLAFLAQPAWAKKNGDEDAEEDETDEEQAPAPKKKKKKPKVGQPEEESSDADEEAEGEAGDEDGPPKKKGKKKDEPFVKQNLSGHDLGTNKKANEFEKDRFFVDKVDTEKTAKGTLVQGSLASSSFAYTESGGTYAGGLNSGENAAKFSRVFTELRLQTDFRHIAASRWDARIDARARVVNTPENGGTSVDPTRIQSGFNGTNEYDLREMWIFHSGKRSDVFFGRQFVQDLGGVKFDGLRVDYASSPRTTFIMFGGLYPLRGSRSLTTDYQPLKDNEGNDAGRLVGTGGFGAAYRTQNTYGALGGVLLQPVKGEQPRVFLTSTGYWRSGAALDIYHFALIDLYGSQGAGLTNLSAGVNYKPSPRLRATASFNRVDVDTLAVQANAFLNEPSPEGVGNNVVQSETYFRRLASNVGRGGLSVGLGQFQRFEISTGIAYRWRPTVAVPLGDGMGTTPVTLQAAKGIEVYGSIIDRRSIKNARIGIDGSRSIAVGDVAYQRSTVLALRAFVSRELASGRGEWEAEVNYNTTRDSATGFDCIDPAMITSCYGASTGALISGGGSLYYRVNRDWFAIVNAFVSRQTLTYSTMQIRDPAVLSMMGYARIAYRF